eukprot:403349976
MYISAAKCSSARKFFSQGSSHLNKILSSQNKFIAQSRVMNNLMGLQNQAGFFKQHQQSGDGNKFMRFNMMTNAQVRFFATGDLPSHMKLEMPNLSPTMEKGNIAKWLKKEGDHIQPGDVLASIETDKASVDFEMQEEGYIAKLLYPEGSKDVKLGQVIAIVVESKEDVAKFANYTTQETATQQQAPAQSQKQEPAEDKRSCPMSRERPQSEPDSTLAGALSGGRVKASPLAQNVAKDSGINLNQVKGSGPDQRIIKADVIEAKSGQKKAPVQVQSSYETIDVNDNRQKNAELLAYSKQNVPHYYVTVQVELDNLLKLRTQLNQFAKTKLTVNDLVLKASALAALKVPACNSSWMGDFIRYYKNVNLGVAVQTDNGYMIPVIREANKKGLDQIAAEVRDLSSRAREGKLRPEELEGATFTVSNLGMFGVQTFQTIVLPPQACILSIGVAEKKALVNEEKGSEQKYRAGHVVNVTLSSDHRVVDGALAAQFGQEFKRFIEHPETLLL